MAGITLDRVSKIFSGGVQAVRDVDLEIADGEFLVLVGPSGCGKTTLMRMIAGLEEVTDGSILIGGEDVTWTEPQHRDIAMVFQNYALYPHMTVRRNLSFGLRLRRTPKAQARGQVHDVAGALGLSELLDRRPAELSGGQRQRVAMGRAIVREPQVFLMDEPLSNLDAKLRVSMRAQLAQLHARLGVTTVYVTHDQAEAMTLGQRVAIMRDGVLQQCDTPERLFDAPSNLFVAAFIGSPAMNLVGADVVDGQACFAGERYRLPSRWSHGDRRDVVLGVRPSDYVLADRHTDPSWPQMSVTATVVERLGSECFVIFRVAAPPVLTSATRAAGSGDDEAALLGGDGSSLFTARVDGRARIAPGDRVDLAVDRERLYVFDRASETLLLGPSSAFVEAPVK